MRFLLLLVAVLVLPFASLAAAVADPATTPTAQYRVTFDSTWSAQSHPLEIPLGPHFSGLIGGTHDASVTFWGAGALASSGIERMAELGSKSPLDSEVQAAINAGHAGQIISGGGIILSPGSVSTTFTASQAFPLVSLVSMVAPSPDWFVGVADLQLAPGGAWVDQLVVPLFGWDAGSDDGATFTSADVEPSPHHPIALLTSGSFSNGVPLGTFTFKRIDTPPAWTNLGQGLAGAAGTPLLAGSGTLAAGTTVTVSLNGAAPLAIDALFTGFSLLQVPFKGGTLVPSVDLFRLGLLTDGVGSLSFSALMPPGVPAGTTIIVQHWVVDAGGPQGFAASNAICGLTP